jgi:hypothetical protein
MIIITGTGRSGTSYIAKFMHKLGLNVLGSNVWLDDKKAGYEHDVIIPVFQAMGNGNKPNALKHLKNIPNCDVLKTPQFVNRDNPEVIKFFFDNIEGLKLVVMRRDFEAVADSFIRYQIIPGVGSKHGRIFKANERVELVNIVANRYKVFIDYLDKENLPYTIVEYGKMIRDEEYGVNIMSEILTGVNKDKITKQYKETTIKK